MENNIANYLKLDTREIQYESDMESFFLKNGYRKISRQEYDKERMIFPSIFIEFIKSTQPKEWGRYERYYGEEAPNRIIKRLNDSIDENGLIYILKHGFKDMGIEIKTCYFKPTSNLNNEMIEKYNKNILGLTRQFPYSTKNTNTIDTILSINGIPVFAFELKNQFKGQDVNNAMKQWKEDRDSREEVFRFNRRFLTYFAVDLYDVYMTTELKGLNTCFVPFNQGSNGAGNFGGKGNPKSESGYATSYLWEEVFTKNSFLDIIENFLVKVKEKKEEYINEKKKSKEEEKIIFPRYHQYDVIHKVLNDVKEKGSGNNYLIEHSAGSGKSNSIAWLSYRLASVFDKNENPIFSSVIVVTNRIVLDNQLQDTINSFDHVVGQVQCITKKEKSEGLKDAINDGKKIIICTVQKFLYAYKDINEIKDKNFAIIIDEAHDGQSGESARTLRKALTDIEKEKIKLAKERGVDPEEIDETDDLLQEIIAEGHHDNQSFFAFTATPTSKTLQVFGTKDELNHRRPFHVYSMKQAIEEGFILDVLKDYTTIKQAFKIAKQTESNPELSEKSGKRALLKYYKEHEFTINQKVEIIMDNFLNNGRYKIDGHGKAMVVCDSRHNAVRFYFAIKDYIKEHQEVCNNVNVLVAFSGTVKFDGDEKEYTESNLNIDKDGHYISSDKKFRDEFHSDNFNIMVVANKYQTGYDEPYLHSMYIDKKLKSVKAVQTLSRLNRSCKNKVDTLILDFENDKEDIKKAFEPYYGETILSGDMDVNRVYDLNVKVKNLKLFNDREVDEFTKLMKKASKQPKQDPSILGKVSAIFKGVIGRYVEIEKEEDRFLARDTLLKFSRCYSFVTQLVRIDDIELFKEYVFVSHLTHLLPKSKEEKISVKDKVSLEYANLKETFHGQIKLEENADPFKPAEPAKPTKRIKKLNTLERIIEEVNKQFEGIFNSQDKVAIESVTKMLMEDKIVKEKLKEFAKDNDINMFIKSIFPEEFRRVLVDCYMKNDEAYNKLLNDSNFQSSVMNIMAKEIYNSLNKGE